MPKHQRDINGLDCQIKSMYGAEISADTVSRIMDKILPEINEWQNRPLKPLYALMFFDAILYPILTEGAVRQRAVNGMSAACGSAMLIAASTGSIA